MNAMFQKAKLYVEDCILFQIRHDILRPFYRVCDALGRLLFGFASHDAVLRSKSFVLLKPNEDCLRRYSFDPHQCDLPGEGSLGWAKNMLLPSDEGKKIYFAQGKLLDNQWYEPTILISKFFQFVFVLLSFVVARLPSLHVHSLYCLLNNAHRYLGLLARSLPFSSPLTGYYYGTTKKSKVVSGLGAPTLAH